MGDDGAPARALGQLDGLQRLRQRADLVDLDEDGIGHAAADALLQDGGVGDEEIVAHELHARAQAPGQGLPPLAVVLAQAVLDGADRIATDEGLVPGDHLLARALHAIGLELVAPRSPNSLAAGSMARKTSSPGR